MPRTNPAPRAAVDELVRVARELEALPAETLERLWPEVTDVTVRRVLAEVMGVPGSEMALVRNATEALDTVLLGVPLRAGDEIVCSAHDYYAMLDALEQRRALGAARKAARLRHLTSHWRARAAAALPGARFYTSDQPAMSIGLCTIEVPGVDVEALKRRLRERDRILVQAMAGSARAPEIRGLRVSPNVYTTPGELDRLVTALAAATGR